MLGITSMLNMLTGGSELTSIDTQSAASYIGKKIATAALVSLDDGSRSTQLLSFDDGKKIAIWDDGQSCCEDRYMSTDDDVGSLVGCILRRIACKAGPSLSDDGYITHDQAFVEIGTDQGFITLVNHNEHNGYYGGFGLTITEEGV